MLDTDRFVVYNFDTRTYLSFSSRKLVFVYSVWQTPEKRVKNSKKRRLTEARAVNLLLLPEDFLKRRRKNDKRTKNSV